MKRLILLILFLLLSSVTFAQDSTQDPAPVATVDAPVKDTPLETASQVGSENEVLKIVVVGITTFIAGIGTGLAGAAILVRTIMANPLWMGLAEWVGGKIVPAPLGRSVKGSLATIGEFVEDVSDGIPESQKPISTLTTYSDGTTYDHRTGIYTHPDGSKSTDFLMRKTSTFVSDGNTLYTVTSTPAVEPPQSN